MKTIDILTLRPLELLHMDIMCPTKTESLGEKKISWLLLMTIQDIVGLLY
jgi:hypothetical protein